MSELVELGGCQIHYWSYAQIIFTGGFASQGLLNKDPIVWLDGRPPPVSLVMSLANSQFNKLSSYEKFKDKIVK